MDRASGLRVGPGCRDGLETEVQTHVVWPAGVRTWLGEHWKAYSSPPAYAADCVEPISSPPQILTPEVAQIAVLVPGLPEDQQEIPLQAASVSMTGRLDWFINGEWLANAKPDERVWWTPLEGTHEVLVMDSSGQTDRRMLEVRRLRGSGG